MKTPHPSRTDSDGGAINDPSTDLWPYQFDAVFNYDDVRGLYLIGGRGAGKSFMDVPTVLHWSELGSDLPFGIFAATEAQLHTVLAPISAALDAIELKHVYESQAPREWRQDWERNGIPFPPRRLRNLKFWIWEDGTHIFTGTLVNNAYTRAKSLDFNAIMIQEGTEPGVLEDAITTLVGCLRCGRATRQRDGTWKCMVPGHLHQMRFVANVPLRNPAHWIYRKVRRMRQQETQREAAGRAPYFKLLQFSTQQNKATGDDYVESLRAALDEETFQEQTSGNLEPRSSSLTYHRFSERNVLAALDDGYDMRRPLHLWFDFNNRPAVAGFGHDLRYDEVPPAERKAKTNYFGVVGELFTGHDPMHTDQVARALLEDPSGRDGRCNELECGHAINMHVNGGAAGMICTFCNFHTDTANGKRFCSGKVTAYEWNTKYLHVPANWRGLIKHRSRIYVYADASGASEHAAAVAGPSLQILRDLFIEHLGERVSFRVKASNPSIRLRELAVNRSLCAANGVRSLYFAPRCDAHLRDCRESVPDPKTGTAKKVQYSDALARRGDDSWMIGHCMDGLGYMIDFRAPAIIPKAGAMPVVSGGDDEAPFEVDLPTP